MKELIEEIVNHCDDIIERSERMTSGNYMHNCLANRFSANTIKTCMGLLSKSVIKWQTGEPKERGSYIVTYRHDSKDHITALYYVGGSWLSGDYDEVQKDKVIAWCNLNDIEPFKM